jgi:hypothetical protein
VAAVVPIKRTQGLLLINGFAVGPVASSGSRLVVEAAGQETSAPSALLQQDLKTGRVRQLAANPNANYGLATTSTAIIYATQKGEESNLMTVSPDGRNRRVLSHALIAPFDARGEMIAWAEADGGRQRVVVRDMRNGRQLVAMDMRKCSHGRCYRIDRVMVADSGVVFDLGAVGQGYPSLVVRREFDRAKPSIVKVQNDPQPDLARSSAGALYYQFQRGWVRWDFGKPKPFLTRFRGTIPWLLDDEQGRLLLLAGSGCKQNLVVRLRDGRKIRIPAPASTPVSPKNLGPLCTRVTSFSWTGRRLLIAWSLIPKISLEAHADVGLAGIVTAVHIPSD